MPTRTLFDFESPSILPVDTRAESARRIAPLLGDMLHQVRRFVEARGPRGATDEEIRLALNMRPDTCRARRCELRDARLVHDSGRRRPTASGRGAVVWVASSSTGVPAGSGPVAPPPGGAAEPHVDRPWADLPVSADAGTATPDSPMSPGGEAAPAATPIQPMPQAVRRSEFYPCAYTFGLSDESQTARK